jgi:cytochrome c biogenesis protein CcmG, thiol:disulfide interchange protein DsbE
VKNQRLAIPILGLLVVIGAAVAAFALASADPDGSSPLPTTGAGASAPSTGGAGTVLHGTSLPQFDRTTATDPAVGMTAPRVTATGSDGQPVVIGPGRPTIVLFLAHWCPHCQAEVPVVQDWVDGGHLPAAIDLVSVSTAIDPAAPNYPPEAWLSREGWTAPVIVDGDRRVATAYGLSAFPYWTVLDAQGRVVLRLTGELTVDQLNALVGVLTAP